jgi:hypothetical protein
VDIREVRRNGLAVGDDKGAEGGGNDGWSSFFSLKNLPMIFFAESS